MAETTGRFESLKGAADFMGPGAIEVPDYENEILDMVRRRGALGQRIAQTPATGHPSRYFEQTAIVSGAFQDPRALAPTAGTPTRIERSVPLKAVIDQTNFSQFDAEVTQQQGQFAYLEAKDTTDMIEGVLKTHDQGLWNGNDTSLTAPTTPQYVGLLTQITQTATIAQGASIIDGLTAEVAAMVASSSFDVMPTAIYVNPILYDLINKEARQAQRVLDDAEVIIGVKVKGLATSAGVLPLIADPFLPTTIGSPNQYPAVITTEKVLEYHWLTNQNPRVFQLGLIGDLATKKVAVKYGGVVAKGASYAHANVTILR
jgi:hypothetical protein